jgi:hypothetical protein
MSEVISWKCDYMACLEEWEELNNKLNDLGITELIGICDTFDIKEIGKHKDEIIERILVGDIELDELGKIVNDLHMGLGIEE